MRLKFFATALALFSLALTAPAAAAGEPPEALARQALSENSAAAAAAVKELRACDLGGVGVE
jgi:hypothetical protein